MGKFDSWVSSLANVRSAGIVSAMIRATGDVAFYILGNTRDAKLTVTPASKLDALLRPWGWGAMVEANIPCFQAGLTEIELLDSIATKLPLTTRFGLSDGLFFNSALIQPSWKLVCGSNFDDFRMIEYAFKGAVLTSEMDALFSAAGATVETPVSSDVLYGLGQAVILADQKPNGLSKVEFFPDAEEPVNLGDFKNAKYTFETLGYDGAGGRMQPRTTAIKFTFDCSAMETELVKIQLMDLMMVNTISLKLTHMDEVTMTLPGTNVQVVPAFLNSGNVDGQREIAIHAEGSLVWNGTSFVSTGGTAWDSIWS